MSDPCEPGIFVVDDDAGVRGFLCWLLRKEGYEVFEFESANDFLAAQCAERCGCLLLDIRMPEMSGLELQSRLNGANNYLPIIMITGHGDVPLAVEAMKAGAFDFLEKPFDNKHLLKRISDALRVSADMVQKNKAREKLTSRLLRLTDRERDVYELLVLGETNKLISNNLMISIKTVEVHRSRVMRKMEVRNISELIKISKPL